MVKYFIQTRDIVQAGVIIIFVIYYYIYMFIETHGRLYICM